MISLAADAQTALPTLSRITPVSPEASAISLYHNYDIDYMTGAPQIEVPLFDIDTKIGKIPFKLSYHVGRLKPSELTGPVGWGWTLTPNLGITRSILGIVDDIGRGYTMNNPYFGSIDCQYNLSLARNSYDEQPDDFYYSLLSGGGRFLYRRDGSFSVPGKVRISRTANDAFQIVDIDGTIYNFGKYSDNNPARVIEKTAKGWPFQTPQGEIASWKVTEIISYDKTDTIKFLYGSPITWDVQHYNAQWRIIEYPGKDWQPQIYRSKYYGANCGNVNTSVWEPMRVRVGGNAWPPASTEMYDAFDVNINEFSNAGLSLWGSCIPFCSDEGIPTTCTWNTSVNYETSMDCFISSTSGISCYNYVVRKEISNYVCPTGMTYANDGMDMPADEVLVNDRIDESVLTAIVFRGGKVTLTYDSSRCSGISIYSLVNGAYGLTRHIKLSQHRVTDNYVSGQAFFRTNYRDVLDSVSIKDASGGTSGKFQFEYLNQRIMPLAVNLNCDMFGYPDMSNEPVPKISYRLNNYKWREVNQTSTGSEWGADKVGTVMVNMGTKQLEEYSPYSYSENIPVAILKKITYPTGGTASFEFERNRFLGPDYQQVFFGGGYRIKRIRYEDSFGKDSLTRTYAYGTNEVGAGLIKFLPSLSDYMYQTTMDLMDPSTQIRTQKVISIFNATPFYSLLFDNGAAVLYPQVTEYIGQQGNNTGKIVYDYFIGGINNTHAPYSPLQENNRAEWMARSLSSKSQYAFLNNSYKLVRKEAYAYTDYVSDTVRAGGAWQRYFHEDDNIVCNKSGVAQLRYNIFPGVKKMTQSNDTLYDLNNTNYLAVTRSFIYDTASLLLRNVVSQTSKGEQKEEKTWYSNDMSILTGIENDQVNMLSALNAANRLNVPVKEELTLNGALKNTLAYKFMLSSANNQIYTSSVLSSVYNNPLTEEVKFLSYDSYGNLLEQQKINDLVEVYFWGYNRKLPVAKIVNGSYNLAKQFINQNILDNPSDDLQLRTELQKLRQNLPGALVTTYTYKPLVGLTSETDPNGRTIYYEYDNFNRLKLIRDQDNKIIKQFDYHYKVPSSQ